MEWLNRSECLNDTELPSYRSNNGSICEAESNGTSTYFNLALVTGFLCIFFVGFFSNILVICVSFRPSRSMTVNTINTYILNLCLSDLIYIVGCVFFTVTNYNLQGWLFGDIGCRIIISLDLFTMHVSSYILTLMSLERYVAVVHPMKSLQYRSTTFARRMSASIWISALILISPMLMAMKEITLDFNGVEKRTCTWDLFGNENISSFYRYQLVVFFITFLLPTVCTACLYLLLVCHFCQTIPPEGTAKRRVRKSRKKVAKIVFMIVFVFWICYSPFWIYQIMSQTRDDINNTFGLVSITLCYLNSCLNPFLYTLLPKKFSVWTRVKSMFTAIGNVTDIQYTPSRSY